MLHLQPKYPELVQSLNYEKASTLPLALRAGIAIDSNEVVEDGTYVESETQSFRMSLGLDKYCLHTPNQIRILDDVKVFNVSNDKVTQFSIRLPEFLKILITFIDNLSF